MSKRHTYLFTPLLLAVFAAPAGAQTPPDQTATSADNTASREGVIAYTPADFAAARPNTALDMINRLPGFSLDGGEQVRGFAGAAGNVLIDGQRPTTKSDSLSDMLGRIPISQVERIDLVRGGASGIDMQGRSVIANVIRKRADTFQQIVTMNGFSFEQTGRSLLGANYQATRRAGDHRFELQLGRGISMDDSVGDGWRTILDVPTGDVTYQTALHRGDGYNYNLRGAYEGPLAGGTFSANAVVSTDDFKNEQYYYAPPSNEGYVNLSENERGEIGLNYKRPVGDDLEVEAIVLSKVAQGEGDSSGANSGGTSQFNIDAESGETIGRSILRYKYSPTLSFEGGGELAMNYREEAVSYSENGQPVQLSASNVRVEELRSEVFVQSAWRPSAKYAIEASVRIEDSTITQSGQIERERSFVYTKPRVLATWSPTENDQLRLRVERQVGQLNFRDFVSNVNLSTNVVSTGNADLEPDKTWIYEAALEKRFWDDAALVLTLRHEDISDVVDLLPFEIEVDADNDGVPDDADNNGVPDTRRVTGVGNIGDGTNNVLALNLTLPLDRIGLAGGELKAETTFRDSEVRDPTTGEKRRISGLRPDDVTVTYRHDLPQHKLTFGLTWFAGWSERNYRPEEVETLDLRNFWATFVEYKPNPSFTVRAGINNFDPYKFTIRRDVYDDVRGTGDLVEIETQRRLSQQIFNIRARWTFG